VKEKARALEPVTIPRGQAPDFMTTSTATGPAAPTAPLPDGPAWDEAFLRVESYLRAHHAESRVLLNRVTAEIIDEARKQERRFPADEPVGLAMRVAHDWIAAWLERAGHLSDRSEARVRTRARLALAVTGLSGRWAGRVFSAEPVPPEFAAALASATLHPGPELSLSNMPTAPWEFGFDDTAPADPRDAGGWSPVRGAGWSVGLIGVFIMVWVQTR